MRAPWALTSFPVRAEPRKEFKKMVHVGKFGCNDRERKKNTQRNPTQRFVFCPPLPPSKFYVFAFSLLFKEKKTARTQRISGVEGPLNGGGFRHGILGEIFVFGCLFGP